MTLPVVLRREAEEDIQEIYDYLEPSGRAQTFADSVRATLDRIEQFPELYGIVGCGRAVPAIHGTTNQLACIYGHSSANRPDS
jgi:plasmid stabilization system protein ParE